MTKKIVFVAVLALSLTAMACGSGSPEDSGQGLHVDSDGVAINGADAVAYFALDGASGAVIGSSEFEFDWMGAIWRFSTQANLETFAADPARYTPRYGGYCSFAMANDDLAGSDPNA
ncbi:MAG: YHS domain protein, partial [Spirochaetales bacterium]|nr:YHS domain protein [Spirochaetales bacterium]